MKVTTTIQKVHFIDTEPRGWFPEDPECRFMKGKVGGKVLKILKKPITMVKTKVRMKNVYAVI
jgi:hypothetical protein